MHETFRKINNHKIKYTVKVDSYVITKPFKTWEKFTSYLKDDEIKFLESVKNTDITSLSISDIEKYNKIKNQVEVYKLLSKYHDQTCTEQEHDLVYDFVNTSLVDFMESKMSAQEKEKAKCVALNLKTKEELENYIDTKENMYDELSPYEAYELYVVKTRQYNIVKKETNEKIKNDQIQRERNLRRKLILDYGDII